MSDKRPSEGNFEKFYRKKSKPLKKKGKSDFGFGAEKKFKKQYAQKKESTQQSSGNFRLNKYLAHAGIASRREADELIKEGLVTVNNKTVREMGYHVQRNDVVKFRGKIIRPERKVYILLNKPKDYITTTDDERDRKTVLDLIKGATEFRVYPVGRLDRNTTGLLLFTNDGDLAQKLSHPSHEVKKVYLATLDKKLKQEDLSKIARGVQLEEGVVKADAVEYADPLDHSKIGIEVHVGWNKVIRRIFEHLGYDVRQLDRVYYGGLTKKDLPRGKWRFLKEKEIIMLKHFV